jgi:hypothetical protein
MARLSRNGRSRRGYEVLLVTGAGEDCCAELPEEEPPEEP